MKNKKGISLLIAIVTTSILLVVSFVVANVALKQLVLAHLSQESQYAFYNADGGTECALYWDLKNPSGTSAFAPYQNVTWQNVVGATAFGNTITKTAVDGWGNAGASSVQSIASGDGYVEFSIGGSTYAPMVGLTTNANPTTYTNINYGLQLHHVDSNVYIYESGTCKFGPTASGCPFISDTPGIAGVTLFRVAIESGVVKYYKDGVLIYTSLVSPTYPIRMGMAEYYNGENVQNGNISVASSGSTISCNSQSISTGSQTVPTTPTQSSVIGGPSSIFNINFPHGCAIVQVTKNIDGSTSVSSKGYNNCTNGATRKLERGINLLYN